MRTLIYNELKNWSIDIPNSFPEKGKLKKEVQMGEYYWEWKGNKIHFDLYSRENAATKIIMLHSLGGNGRLLSFIGVPLWRAGFEIICPDLPPFGLTELNGDKIIYQDWISIIRDLVNHEKILDDKPIFLFGHGISGMLAYHVAALSKNVSGIIVTSLLDQREIKVKMSEALNKIVGVIELPAVKMLNRVDHDLSFAMKELINIKKIIGSKEICRLLSEDEYSWKKEVNINFLSSLLSVEPPLEPEYFHNCPVLFASPEKDKWTPFNLSKIFFDRLACRKKIVILKNASHLPIEEPGLSELEYEITRFSEELINE